MNKVYPISKQVGLKIRYYRKLNKLSLSYVAKELGFSQQQQLRYERGENRISIGRIKSYAIFFKIEIKKLLPDEYPKNDFSDVDLNILKNLKVSYIYE